MAELPSQMAQLTSLEHLELDQNALEDLPPFASNWANLSFLWLANNHLESVPSAVLELTNLRRLSLSNNRIVTVPENISRLVNLQDFYLSGNKILQLPSEVVTLPNLRQLELRGNPITHLPLDIIHSSSLKVLGVEDCNDLVLPPGASLEANAYGHSFYGDSLKRLMDRFRFLERIRLYIYDKFASGSELEFLPDQALRTIATMAVAVYQDPIGPSLGHASN